MSDDKPTPETDLHLHILGYEDRKDLCITARDVVQVDGMDDNVGKFQLDARMFLVQHTNNDQERYMALRCVTVPHIYLRVTGTKVNENNEVVKLIMIMMRSNRYLDREFQPLLVLKLSNFLKVSI